MEASRHLGGGAGEGPRPSCQSAPGHHDGAASCVLHDRRVGRAWASGGRGVRHARADAGREPEISRKLSALLECEHCRRAAPATWASGILVGALGP
eukprot:390473-Alexandrium_andersonii.AAC.1